jgi:hypothetical protein
MPPPPQRDADLSTVTALPIFTLHTYTGTCKAHHSPYSQLLTLCCLEIYTMWKAFVKTSIWFLLRPVLDKKQWVLCAEPSFANVHKIWFQIHVISDRKTHSFRAIRSFCAPSVRNGNSAFTWRCCSIFQNFLFMAQNRNSWWTWATDSSSTYSANQLSHQVRLVNSTVHWPPEDFRDPYVDRDPGFYISSIECRLWIALYFETTLNTTFSHCCW